MGTEHLCCIDLSRVVDAVHDILQATDVGPPVPLLEQAKTSVRRELGMANKQEGHGDRAVQSCHHSPC